MSWSTYGERMLPALGDPLMCLWPAVCMPNALPQLSYSVPVCLSLVVHASLMERDGCSG